MRYAEGKASRSEGMEVEDVPLQNCSPSKFWENYSAFANSGGGSIDIHNVGGFDSDIDEAIMKIKDGTSDRSVISSNVLMDSDIRRTADGIAINVPSADRRLRPVFVGDSEETGTFVRSEGKTVRCDPDNIRSMVRDSADAALFRTLAGTDISILNTDSIRYFRRSIAGKGHIWDSKTDDEFLLLTDAVTDVDGWLRPTDAGLLLFSNYYTISSTLQGYRLRYSDEKNIIDSEDGHWTGNITDFLMKISEKDSCYFQEIGDPVKEIIINALAHSDFNFGEGVSVIYSENEISVSNYGMFRSGEEKSVNGIKDRRNPSVAKLLGLISPCRGLGAAISTINKAGYEVSIDEDHVSGRITVSINGSYSSAIDSPVAEIILNEISSDCNVTVSELAEKIGMSVRQVQRHISELRSSGLLTRVGSRRAGSWKIL